MRIVLAIYRVIRSVILTGAAIIGGIAIAAFVVSLIVGVRPLNVISGSMEPTIPTGAMVFSKKIPASEIKVGDIITTNRTDGDSGLITHRVVSIVQDEGARYTMEMRGDANQSDDPQPYVITEAYRYLFHIPVLGFISTLIKTRFGIGILIALAALFGIFVMFPGDSEPKEDDPEPAAKTRRGAAPASTRKKKRSGGRHSV